MYNYSLLPRTVCKILNFEFLKNRAKWTDTILSPSMYTLQFEITSNRMIWPEFSLACILTTWTALEITRTRMTPGYNFRSNHVLYWVHDFLIGLMRVVHTYNRFNHQLLQQYYSLLTLMFEFGKIGTWITALKYNTLLKNFMVTYYILLHTFWFGKEVGTI